MSDLKNVVICLVVGLALGAGVGVQIGKRVAKSVCDQAVAAIPECSPCDECPECDECVGECANVIKPTEPTGTVSAPVPETTKSAEWISVTDPATLAGKWQSTDGKPMPEVEFFVAKQGSKTPFNVTIRTRQVDVGCGFYATGTAFCQVHDKDHRTVPRKIETVVGASMRGDLLSVLIPEAVMVEVRR